jgi:hypothetical protein
LGDRGHAGLSCGCVLRRFQLRHDQLMRPIATDPYRKPRKWGVPGWNRVDREPGTKKSASLADFFDTMGGTRTVQWARCVELRVAFAKGGKRPLTKPCPLDAICIALFVYARQCHHASCLGCCGAG